MSACPAAISSTHDSSLYPSVFLPMFLSCLHHVFPPSSPVFFLLSPLFLMLHDERSRVVRIRWIPDSENSCGARWRMTSKLSARALPLLVILLLLLLR